MSPKKTKELIGRFPKLYRGSTKPITESLMAFGFEVADGWFDLIAELSQKIDDIAKATNTPNDEYPEAVQVKEKYGGLRFYIDNGTDEVFAAIDEAEARSVKICETCGQIGRQIGTGWIVTICEACEKKNEQEKKA